VAESTRGGREKEAAEAAEAAGTVAWAAEAAGAAGTAAEAAVAAEVEKVEEATVVTGAEEEVATWGKEEPQGARRVRAQKAALEAEERAAVAMEAEELVEVRAAAAERAAAVEEKVVVLRVAMMEAAKEGVREEGYAVTEKGGVVGEAGVDVVAYMEAAVAEAAALVGG